MPDLDPHPDYRDMPDHPLRNVPAFILEAARALCSQAVVWNDVADDAAEPLADAVVAEVLPGMKTWLVEKPEDPDSLRLRAAIERELQQPSITCPRCGRISHRPRDVEEGYCGNCHRWTGLPGGNEPEEVDGPTLLDGVVASVMVVVHPQAGRRILEVSNTGPAGLSREQMIELFELAVWDLRRQPG